jgi:hypothetical protein
MPSRICRLPHAAVSRPEIEDEGVPGISRHRRDAPSPVRPHEAPLEGRKKAGVHAVIAGEDDFAHGHGNQDEDDDTRSGEHLEADPCSTANRIHCHLHRHGVEVRPHAHLTPNVRDVAGEGNLLPLPGRRACDDIDPARRRRWASAIRDDSSARRHDEACTQAGFTGLQEAPVLSLGDSSVSSRAP